ncbi:MAG: proteasome assembly chaperone family protein [Desulfurococcaceae archaeon]
MAIKFVPLRSLEESELKDSILITGYQGFGLVGYLATRHLVKELKLSKIGFIKTRYMPEATLYTRDLDIVFPFEIYAGTAGANKLVVVLHNQTPHERERTDYAEFLAKWAKGVGVKEVILIGGLSADLKEDPNETYRWIPINDTTITLSNAKLLEERHVIGPLALTIMFMKAYNLKGVVLLPFAEPYRPDPKASAVAVGIISQILGVDISVQKLIEEAAIIEAIEEEFDRLKRLSEEGEKKSRLTYI